MRHQLRLVLCTAALALVGGAVAHAYLESASPAAWSVLEEVPEAVELRFSEPIETRFSTLKVYALEVPSEAMPADPANPNEREWQRLSALAAQLVAQALETEDDAQTRADTGLLTEARTAATVTLGLQDELAPGIYVVMWDVLSIDTHWTNDHYLFIVALPES